MPLCPHKDNIYLWLLQASSKSIKASMQSVRFLGKYLNTQNLIRNKNGLLKVNITLMIVVFVNKKLPRLSISVSGMYVACKITHTRVTFVNGCLCVPLSFILGLRCYKENWFNIIKTMITEARLHTCDVNGKHGYRCCCQFFSLKAYLVLHLVGLIVAAHGERGLVKIIIHYLGTVLCSLFRNSHGSVYLYLGFFNLFHHVAMWTSFYMYFIMEWVTRCFFFFMAPFIDFGGK